MARVECDLCKKTAVDLVCTECLKKATDEVQNLNGKIFELQAKIKKMNEFMSAYDELSKIKEKI